MKRVVRLKNKITEEIDTYPTLSDLVTRNGEEELGITQPALYNAMHTGRGFWENKKYCVFYENIDLGNSVWK